MDAAEYKHLLLGLMAAGIVMPAPTTTTAIADKNRCSCCQRKTWTRFCASDNRLDIFRDTFDLINFTIYLYLNT